MLYKLGIILIIQTDQENDSICEKASIRELTVKEPTKKQAQKKFIQKSL